MADLRECLDVGGKLTDIVAVDGETGAGLWCTLRRSAGADATGVVYAIEVAFSGRA